MENEELYTEKREYEVDLQDVTEHLHGSLCGRGDKWWLENATCETLVEDEDGNEVEAVIPVKTIDDVPVKYGIRKDVLNDIERFIDRSGFETHTSREWARIDAECCHEGGIPHHDFI